MIAWIICGILLMALGYVIYRWYKVWKINEHHLTVIYEYEEVLKTQDSSIDNTTKMIESINAVILDSYTYLHQLKRSDLLMYGTEEIRNIVMFINKLEATMKELLLNQGINSEDGTKPELN